VVPGLDLGLKLAAPRDPHALDAIAHGRSRGSDEALALDRVVVAP